ncbi:hypothetical protein Forpe1208_v000003 [Fusarium oxysporum f. sp. rapae]|uniref:Uncharacterized protein n=1 Tax=Fusarium oxysporum f. sp. rapae TaxID=485398 RepID=A0A8J5NK61_FUSOX|nr:hypothetical protein Forpe1208_v016929 [Fusarium oxysporum f. sp. rapae]KAG7403361.1 hypothetical protein Forpe1208_v016391 [Fusarium oxysporum f. sp. rapae]KAG7407146.1 hypothetical protein Forpe1208_v013559 [Fusarium oxysporum f. sp. rapae]KAG7409930.1 hypothetical protein Forpe1208_v011135 [Fusarium oxysporum f. sp. rapae]KAG7411161.1 hypothetical protein Forpe1208_v010689 [Fusarium oxysporum f. sp. rapae]
MLTLVWTCIPVHLPAFLDVSEKSLPPSTIRRHKAADGIDQFGFEVMPCSRCEKRGAICKMVEGKKKCGLCVRLGRPCDVTGTPLNSLTRIITEAKRLDQREAEAEELLSRRREALRQAQRELDESLSELESCRKRKRDLTKKGAEMTRRGLDSLEALERAEQAEVPQEQLVIEDVNSLVHSDILDLSFLDPSFFDGGSSSGVVGH